jgi:hypothetical protein
VYLQSSKEETHRATQGNKFHGSKLFSKMVLVVVVIAGEKGNAVVLLQVNHVLSIQKMMKYFSH